MAIPPFHVFMRPVLEAVADGAEHHRTQVRAKAVAALHLTEEELAETLRGGSNRAGSRAHWAMEYLSQAGALHRPRRGHVAITDVGRQLLATTSGPISVEHLADLPGYQDWLRRSREASKARREGTDEPPVLVSEDSPSESPLEQLVEALEVLEQGTADELVQRLREQPPVFLERAVLKLLHAMGYGGSADDGEHLGRSNDGGLDGVIRQDALGMNRIYVQAKRYASDNPVGPAAIREFVGAITGAGGVAGVFITTSDFTFEARKFADHVNPRVVLINGHDLGRYMIKYGIGVTVAQTIRVTEVDENFFESD